MRAIALLLVLVNLGLLGWSRWVATAPMPSARPLPASVERLALVAPPGQVREDEVGGEVLADASVESDPQEAGEPAPPAAVPASIPAAELAGSQLVVIAPSAQAQCASVGPFLDLAGAAEFAAAVRARGLEPGQRRLASDVWVGYSVMLPPLPSREAARATASALREAGVEDLYIEPGGDLRNAISLGLFSQRDGADRHAKAIRDLGFEPEIRDRTRTADVYFVDFEVPAGKRVDLSRFERQGRRLSNGVCSVAAA
ncbi:MAG: hypothetical protein AAGA68_01825 [Pseudomonadota bacterium]